MQEQIDSKGIPTSIPTSTLGEMLQKAGIQTVQLGQKETRKKSVLTLPALPARKFAFGPRQLVKPQLIMQNKEDRQQNLTNLENYRRDIGPFLYDLVSQRRALLNGTEDEVTLAQADIDSITATIAAELNQEHPQGKQVAVLTYADAMVRTCPEFRGQVVQTLQGLVAFGFFKEVDGKGVRIYGCDYILAEEFTKSSEAKKVGEALSQLVNRTVVAGKQRFETDLAALRTAAGESQLTVADMKAGKDGRMLFGTPDHQHRDRFYKGGTLLLESIGGQIRVLDGVGGCQRIARQLAEAGTYVWNTQVSHERLEMKEYLLEEIFRNVLILHGLIYRGIAVMEKAEAADQRKAEFKEQTAAERKTLAASATLTLVEFFLFSRVGTTVLDPLGRKPFEIQSREKDKGPTLVWDVIALIERDEQNRIRVADCPERLNGFFANFREFVPAGEKFSAVKWPFGVLLRMGYAAACTEATPEQKAEVQQLQVEAEAAHKAVAAQAEQELVEQLAAGTGEDLTGVSIPDPSEGRS